MHLILLTALALPLSAIAEKAPWSGGSAQDLLSRTQPLPTPQKRGILKAISCSTSQGKVIEPGDPMYETCVAKELGTNSHGNGLINL